MVLLDVYLDNIYGFHDFHVNFSYPKRIVNSVIDDENLSGRPNFRYKKAVILMGANATGKTTLGKALLSIFNLIEHCEASSFSNAIHRGKEGRFAVEFVNGGDILHRVSAVIGCDDELRITVKEFCHSSVTIGLKDSYESCTERLNRVLPVSVCNDSFKEISAEIGSVDYVFSCPELKPSSEITKADKATTLNVLQKVIGTLDPSLNDVTVSRDLKNAYIIRREDEEIIIQDGKLLNRESLSSGTAEGVDIAFFLSLIISGSDSFYYCDEHFSYIQSDIEKRIFGLMLDHLGKNEQLIFTTHNPDMLDLNLPKHSFAFLGRNPAVKSVTVTFASEKLKRNTDSVHCASDNDVFNSLPDDSLLDLLEKEPADE